MPRCKHCKKNYERQYPMQVACSIACAIALKNELSLVKKVDGEMTKVWKRETKEKHKDASHYRKELQILFNKFIRIRDKDTPCISCDRNMVGRKGDASHFFSVGSYPNLRYDEDNVHLACVPCNQHRGGNLIEYALRLPKRIGEERFESLKDRRNIPSYLSVPELIEKIDYYKSRIKELEQE